MFEIKAVYERIARIYPKIYGVVGKRFEDVADAERFLSDNGWIRDDAIEGEWKKDDPTRMFGQVGVSFTHYVRVACE